MFWTTEIPDEILYLMAGKRRFKITWIINNTNTKKKTGLGIRRISSKIRYYEANTYSSLPSLVQGIIYGTVLFQ